MLKKLILASSVAIIATGCTSTHDKDYKHSHHDEHFHEAGYDEHSHEDMYNSMTKHNDHKMKEEMKEEMAVVAAPVMVEEVVSEEPVSVVVEPGDTLSELIKEHSSDGYSSMDNGELKTWVMEVSEMNGISNPNLIYPGQTLTIPKM